MPEELFNLLISGDEKAWESNSVIFPLDRCLREYTDKNIVERYAELGNVEIDEIKKFPCIFAYEDYYKKPASIGYITDILIRSEGIKISFQKVETLSIEDLNKLLFELDIRKWELNRTHWAIKKVNLLKELQQIGISVGGLKTNEIVDIAKHYFNVSFSFAGEWRQDVEQVVTELRKKIDKENMFYDNYYISQLARPNLDTLLQDIYRKRSKLIVVFLCEKYQEKEWCGLELRAIREMIKQKELDKIMFIRLDSGHVDGVFTTDGYIDGTKFTPKELANFIYERLHLLGSGTSSKQVFDKKIEEPSSSVVAKLVNLSIDSTVMIHKKLDLEGKVSFNYANNNGVFVIGNGEYSFDTKWSKGDNTIIHALDHGNNIKSIGYKSGQTKFPYLKDLHEFDFSSYFRSVRTGEIVVWQNKHDKFAVTKILKITDINRGDESDNLLFEYKIYE